MNLIAIPSKKVPLVNRTMSSHGCIIRDKRNC